MALQLKLLKVTCRKANWSSLVKQYLLPPRPKAIPMQRRALVERHERARPGQVVDETKERGHPACSRGGYA